MSETFLHLDFETKSAIDLKKTGVYRYFEDPSTEFWCGCYSFDGEDEVGLWLPGQPLDPRVDAHIRMGGPIVAHNKDFERTALALALGPHYGWPIPEPDQWHCTAALGAIYALPRTLDGATYVMGVPHQKDDEGHRLMLQMCKPRKIVKPGDKDYDALRAMANANGSECTVLPDDRIIVWWYSPEKLSRLIAYCQQDVRAEKDLHKVLPPMTAGEREVFLLDMAINDRGLLADPKMVRHSLKVAESAMAALTDEMLSPAVTNGMCGPTQVAALIEFLIGQGIPAHSIDKENIELLLARKDITPRARRAIEIRREAANGVGKLDAMINRASLDGRVRGSFLYAAAHTLRWSSVGVQFQNMKRPTGEVDIKLGVDYLSRCVSYEMINALVGPPLSVISECMRGHIQAAEGYEYVTGDFSNIEGRVNAWLHDERWKMQAFADYDTITGYDDKGEPIRKGRDLYLIAAERMNNVPEGTYNKKSPERQHGKVAELSMGYQGGIGAFNNMAKNYKVYVEDKKADEIKRAWRTAHPRITDGWKELDDAAIEAVQNPGKKVWACNGKICFVVAGRFLHLRLPNGEFLHYCRPEMRIKRWKVKVFNTDTDQMEEKWMEKNSVHFWGVDSRTRKWARLTGYGGFWCENIVQAISRQLLSDAMKRIQARWGHLAPPGTRTCLVLHAHDEAVSEVPIGSIALKDYEAEMAIKPAYIGDCPIAVEGWIGKRYKK